MISRCRSLFNLGIFTALTLIALNIYSEVVTVPTSPSPSAPGPATRPRIDDLQKESSSFVADPDPLDPLPLKKESLKEDEEPVLEDIRQILNAPVKKTPTQIKKQPKRTENLKNKKSVRKAKIKKNNYSINQLKPDDPDQNMENALFRKYKKFNIQPTSAEQWAKVTSDRKVEIFVVEKGNTLESISRILFGDSQFWPKIWALNHSSISNPHFIYPGMKIYFYPATATDLPSMNVGAPNDPTIAITGLSLDGRDYTPQQTDFEKFTIKYQKRNAKNKDVPQPVPDSIPLVRRKEYFDQGKGLQTIIDIQPRPEIALTAPKNPYLLSSVALATDFVVPADQIDRLVCKENQFIPQIKKVNLQAVSGKFLMIEPLKTENYRLKKTFVYKIIGHANITESNQMRVKNCDQLMNSDTLIVSEDKIQNLPEPTETFKQSARLVESLTSPMQDFFNFGQLVIVNGGDLNPTAGQDLEIYSETAGGVVGKLKIIQSAGTLAVGYLIEISQLIQIGDRIQNSEGSNQRVEDIPAIDSELSL